MILKYGFGYGFDVVIENDNVVCFFCNFGVSDVEGEFDVCIFECWSVVGIVFCYGDYFIEFFL